MRTRLASDNGYPWVQVWSRNVDGNGAGDKKVGNTWLLTMNHRAHLIQGDRHGAQTHAGCVEYRIRDGGRHDSRRLFAPAAAAHCGQPIDEIGLDLGNVRRSQDRITLPVEACHVQAVQGVISSHWSYEGQYPPPPSLSDRTVQPECGFSATESWGPNGFQWCDPKNIYRTPPVAHPNRYR